MSAKKAPERGQRARTSTAPAEGNRPHRDEPPAASWPAWTDSVRYTASPVRHSARTGKGVPG